MKVEKEYNKKGRKGKIQEETKKKKQVTKTKKEKK